MKPFWVYILRCADHSYYTGHTEDLDRRIAQHEAGDIPSCYTFKRRPVVLVFCQPCVTREEALSAERQIKGWSRKKKEAMMRGDWAEVSRLARSSVNQAALRQAQGERVDAQGDRADVQRDRANAQGDRANAQGERVDAQGDRANAQGERANAQGERADVQGERAAVQGEGDDAQGKWVNVLKIPFKEP